VSKIKLNQILDKEYRIHTRQINIEDGAVFYKRRDDCISCYC